MKRKKFIKEGLMRFGAIVARHLKEYW